MMQKFLIGFSIIIALFSCSTNDTDLSPEPIVEPAVYETLGEDSITTGGYLTLNINDSATEIYSKIQKLNESKKFNHLNLVDNIHHSGVKMLKDRIQLYSYIVLDEEKGTETGVQISLKAGKIESIFLSSGKKLQQWPENTASNFALRVGDMASVMYEKLLVIESNKSYENKFQSISLLVKDVLLPLDSEMVHSPMWYFVNNTGDNTWELVELNFNKEQRLSLISVRKYRNRK